MRIDPNDPRLTAYVLGELDDTERAEIESALGESEALRKTVAEIRATAGILSEALRDEPSFGLTSEQVTRIESQASRPAGRGRYWLTRGLAAAASILLVVLLAPQVWQRWGEEPFDVADLGNYPRDFAERPALVAPSLESAGSEPAAPPTKVDVSGGSSETVPAPTEITAAQSRQPERAQQPAATSKPVPKAEGALYGTVTDPSGMVIPGAEVQAEHLQKNLLRTEFANERGRFEFTGLPAGEVEVRAEMPGFKEFAQKVEIAEGAEVAVNPILQVGEVSDEMTIVSGSAPLVTNIAETSQQIVGAEPVRDLPLRGPTVASLMQLVGGVPSPAGKMSPGYSSYITRADKPDVGADRPTIDLPPDFNTEAYDRLVDNPFRLVTQHPLSTFSIDVDTASYSNVRRFLNEDSLPPKDAVRIEELINYFSYDYPQPKGEDPFSVNLEVASAPWQPDHHLVRIGLQGREIGAERPAGNLVFLLDVSGSMRPPNKLPLLKRAMQLLINKLNENDQVAIVVYAGASGLVLPSTPGQEREKILASLEKLEAGGSTNGGAGIQLAYDTAMSHFVKGGINRVVLATDGDFNVGVTNQGDLTRLIEEKAKSGVFLSVLGFGMGNYKDSNLEKLADKGNGNYAYIDTLNEARKVLVEEMNSTLVTIAKDVKIQVEFNPARVSAYRLIGYENRLLRAEDFNDDRKDAGEIGAGHSVTVLYELVPPGKEVDVSRVDPLKYQQLTQPAPVASASNELLTVKLRYKQPDGQVSKLIEQPLTDSGMEFARASADFGFAAAVASFGMLLRDSEYKGNSTFEAALELAQAGRGEDRFGYRQEFIKLVEKAKWLAERPR